MNRFTGDGELSYIHCMSIDTLPRTRLSDCPRTIHDRGSPQQTNEAPVMTMYYIIDIHYVGVITGIQKQFRDTITGYNQKIEERNKIRYNLGITRLY